MNKMCSLLLRNAPLPNYTEQELFEKLEFNVFFPNFPTRIPIFLPAGDLADEIAILDKQRWYKTEGRVR